MTIIALLRINSVLSGGQCPPVSMFARFCFYACFKVHHNFFVILATITRTRYPVLKLLTYLCVEFFARLRHRAWIYSCAEDGRSTLEQRPTEVNGMEVILCSAVIIVVAK